MDDKKTLFSTGAVRDTQENKNRPDLIPPECLWRLGWLYAKGCEHYGPHNWEKGIPTDSFIASMDRHWLKYKLGWDDEDHLAAAVFNLFGIMFNEIHNLEGIEVQEDEE